MDEDLSQQLQDAICDKIYQLLTTLFRHSHFRRLTIWVKSLAERKRKHAQHSQPRDSARRVCKIEFDMDVEPVGGQSAAALKLVEQDNDTSRDLLKGQLVVTPDVEGSSLIEPKKVAGFGLFADPEFHHLYTAAHQD